MEELWLRIRPLFPTAKASIRAKPGHPWTAAGTPTLLFLPRRYIPTVRASFQNRAAPPLSNSPAHLAHSCLRAFARLFPCPKYSSPRCLHGQPSPLLPALLTRCLLNTPPPPPPTKNCNPAWHHPVPLLPPPSGSVVWFCFLPKHFSPSHIFCNLLILTACFLFPPLGCQLLGGRDVSLFCSLMYL